MTPFYFLKAGSLVDFHAIASSAGLIPVFLLIKMATKFAGILPLTKRFNFEAKEGMYTPHATDVDGLTFGSISALFGLNKRHHRSAAKYHLVAAVIGSAVVPTLIAQRWFMPALKPLDEEAEETGEALGWLQARS